ncbi:OmpW/AlkL family protein [Sansalvadorimonas verongulae]|uniref:OmpW/AlkL family protein n=1 Tax=Sansalvadorimonas verongulae TaxID=2172824 RepID=UPI0012BD6E75|nr:OmpW family outer membrane protein [Sansalvadorimonas verongulae]MTI14414.1 OmpW family protein [Sansalvadorimonas verongulae]
MFGKKFLVSLAVAGGAAAMSVPASAGVSEGDLAWKFGLAYIVPDENTIKWYEEANHELHRDKLKKDKNPITLSFDLVYMATDEIGINCGTSYPAKVKQKVSGTDKGKYEYDIMPLHVTAQYYFMMPQDEFRPYVGAGVHYTYMKSFKIDHKDYDKIDFDKDYGYVLQVGGIFNLDDDLFVDASARYFYLKPEGKADVKPEHEHTRKVKVKDYKINPWMFNVSFGMKF